MLVNYPALKTLLSQNFPEHQDSALLSGWVSDLPNHVDTICNPQRHGDLETWITLANSLPKVEANHIDLSQAAPEIGADGELSNSDKQAMHEILLSLKPWRKGPFNLFGIHIDTEWQSNMKWSRLSAHVDLREKRVLDIGCGNGYYALRMLGAGAKMVLGIDPSPRFLVQQHVLKRFLPNDLPFHFLPVGIEHIPNNLACFDTTFSMGVFYHRRSPIDHLNELKNTLRPGGELILETLVIDGDQQDVLIPENRYAMMRNVWFIPSVDALTHWIKRVGFQDIEVIDVSYTTTNEQRTTKWMEYHSLEQFLDPSDHSKTIEGYPAPMRVIIKAINP